MFTCSHHLQDDVLLPALTVRQTLRYTAALKLDLPKPEREQRVQELMADLGLTGVAKTLVGM